MMITTLLIAVPTGIKIFSWLGTLFQSVLHLRSTAMLFALAFIVTFTIGGISGVMLGMIPVDIHVSDTYFIVAHIHFVLFGGSVFTIFAGVYHWFPKMTGRMYDEKLGRVHFWGTLVGTWGHRRFTFGIHDRAHTVGHQLLGVTLLVFSLAVTAVSLELLELLAGDPGQVAEVAVLVAANLGCGLVRFATFRVAMLPRDVRRRRAGPA